MQNGQLILLRSAEAVNDSARFCCCEWRSERGGERIPKKITGVCAQKEQDRVITGSRWHLGDALVGL